MLHRSVAATLTHASLWSWLGFSVIELLLPTSVMRTFSPHWFLLTLLVGVVWWYREARRV